jgi:methionyl-tRNA formyltransferase
VFFGAGPIAARALQELDTAGILPLLIVSSPDRPAGRGKNLTPSPVSAWAAERNIEIFKPEKLDAEFLSTLETKSTELKVTTFVVIDYGKILPKKLLDIPPRGTLNMHPSLLPRLRGPSPIRSAILSDEKKTGVSVILLDEKLDHGPILAQKVVEIPMWPPRGRELDELLASEGGKLLATVLPLWARDEIEAHEQNHDLATYCQQFSKEDGLLDLSDDAYQNLLKIRAFDGWPGTYTFFERPTVSNEQFRLKIISAHIENGRLVLDIVKPEGKGEIPYTQFLQSGAKLV